MFPILCLVTFAVFTSYWLLTLAYNKTLSLLHTKQQPPCPQQPPYKITIKTCQDPDEDEPQPQSLPHYEPQPHPKQKPNEVISKLTSISTNPENYRSDVITNIVMGSSVRDTELDGLGMGSQGDLLDVAMIQENASCVQGKVGERKGEGEASKEGIKDTSHILGQIIQPGQDIPQQHEPLVQNRYQPQLAPITNQIQQHPTQQLPQSQKQQKTLKQQRSELQLLQALSTHKSDHPHQNTLQIEQISQIQQKQQECSNVLTEKLMQQIDQLFLNNQEEFMRVMDKYRVREARYEGTRGREDREEKERMEKEMGKLEELLRKKGEEMDIMQIEISQYKQACEAKQAQIQTQKQIISNLQQTIQKLQSQPSQQSSPQQPTQHLTTQPSPSCPSPITQAQQKIKTLTYDLTNSIKQIQNLCTNLQQERARNSQLMKEYSQLERDYDLGMAAVEGLKKEVEDLRRGMIQSDSNGSGSGSGINGYQRMYQKDYMEKLEKFEQQIQRIRDEATAQKRKYDQLLSLYNKSISQLPQSPPVPILSQQVQQAQLQKSYQNLKNEIEFAQTQIRMFEQTQAAYIKQVEELEISNGELSREILELRSKISRMQPIANEYETMQRRYFQLKLKYDRLLHEKPQLNTSGKREQALNNSRKREEPHNPYPSSLLHSPKNARYITPTIHIDSPSSTNDNNKKNSPGIGVGVGVGGNMGSYRFLFDCGFVGLQDREFVYQVVRSLLKGVLKTEKLYNSKTNKGKNPHDLIDNIRGILLIIHLQNNKLLGAYSHEPFSPSHPQSTPQNISFLLDITNRRSFTNQSGLNSIIYNPNSLVWGFNQILLKYEESQVMYTNFCRNHNIYWDGRYRVEDFIGVDKQWARILEYEVFRVVKM